MTKKETPKSSEIWNRNARKIGKILSLSLLNKDRWFRRIFSLFLVLRYFNSPPFRVFPLSLSKATFMRLTTTRIVHATYYNIIYFLTIIMEKTQNLSASWQTYFITKCLQYKHTSIYNWAYMCVCMMTTCRYVPHLKVHKIY